MFNIKSNQLKWWNYHYARNPKARGPLQRVRSWHIHYPEIRTDAWLNTHKLHPDRNARFDSAVSANLSGKHVTWSRPGYDGPLMWRPAPRAGWCVGQLHQSHMDRSGTYTPRISARLNKSTSNRFTHEPQSNRITAFIYLFISDVNSISEAWWRRGSHR